MSLPAIYLDHHAHTPLDPAVRAVLVEALSLYDVNIHATSEASAAAQRQVETAREQVANLLGVASGDIIFTSGATEANNTVFRALADHFRRSDRRRLVISAAEHPSVLATAKSLAPDFEVVEAPLRSTGEVDLDALQRIVTDQTGLVSVAAANHEIGTLQPLAAIGVIARGAGALMHSDLAQAAGKTELDLSEVQLASVSGHKLYGPMGIGALMARRSVRRVMTPLMTGGGQELGLRAGTLPAPLCVAFGAACALAGRLLGTEAPRLRGLRNRLLHRLQADAQAHANGALEPRLPGNLNVRFEEVDAEALVMRLRTEVTIATGSACHAQSLEPSPVLLALGLTQLQAESSVRIGIGRFTSEADIDAAAHLIVGAVAGLRSLRLRATA